MAHTPDSDSVHPSPEDDLAVLRRAQSGDFTAFELLVTRLQGRVYRLAFRILGQVQDSEDVVQQTFLSMIEHLDTFRAESAVSTWVLRIATNFALKTLRKKRGLTTIPFNEPEDSLASVPHPDYIARWGQSPELILEQLELQELLKSALTELDERYRVVFVLRDIEGLSTHETAATLGLSESNVKVRLLRARLQLRERLTRALGDSSTQVQPDDRHRHP